jgi:hypothetical protein
MVKAKYMPVDAGSIRAIAMLCSRFYQLKKTHICVKLRSYPALATKT